ncbi:MAG: hypothetical protein OET90_02395 [Desulfuromonadales bacterium]|nr:hypothetical protein [Desulfuromonadales bacterium]
MERFQASVQYNDMKGTAAADGANPGDLGAYLLRHGYINDGEFVMGVTMSVGENRGTHTDPVYVKFLVSGLRGNDNLVETIQASDDPIPVKEVCVDMNITDFLALFKRFNVAISVKGLLDGRSYTSA